MSPPWPSIGLWKSNRRGRGKGGSGRVQGKLGVRGVEDTGSFGAPTNAMALQKRSMGPVKFCRQQQGSGEECSWGN